MLVCRCEKGCCAGIISPGFHARKVCCSSQIFCHLGSIKWNGYCLRVLDIGAGYWAIQSSRAMEERSTFKNSFPTCRSTGSDASNKGIEDRVPPTDNRFLPR